MNGLRPRYGPLVSTPAERRVLVAWLARAARSAAGVGAGASAASGPRAGHVDDEFAPPDVPPASLLDLPALAEGHGVAAQLPAPALAGLPELVRLAVDEAAERTLARGVRLAVERRLIAEALAARQVPFRWLKGAWLIGLHDVSQQVHAKSESEGTPEQRTGEAWASGDERPPLRRSAVADSRSGPARWPKRPAADLDLLVPARAATARWSKRPAADLDLLVPVRAATARWSKRPAADLDLLVPARAAADAALALRAIGYRPDHRTARHAVFARPEYVEVVDLRGEHPDNPMPVEVHTQLGESFRGIGIDWTPAAWEDADVAGAGGELPLYLGLLHLAAHATADALNRRLRLAALLDLEWLAPLLSSSDWDALLARAATPAAARFAWPALTMAAAAPPDVLAQIGSRVRPALRQWVAAMDVDRASRFGRRDAPRRFNEVLDIWPLGSGERLRMWRFIVAPARGELADRYPGLAARPWWPLIYVLHAGYNLRVVWHRGRAAMR